MTSMGNVQLVLKRAAEVHLAQDSVNALRQQAFQCLGQLALAGGQPGQAFPEEGFQQFCRTVVPSASQVTPIGCTEASVQQLRLI